MVAQHPAPLKTIRVQDFQVHEDTTLELGGLVILTGPGDAGKSAILRAMRATFLNEGHDEDIRHGAKKAIVTLTFGDGIVIEWWKEQGKGGCYRAFGKEYTKTGGEVPEEIATYLGIGQIVVGDDTLTPQLSDQHDAPFIIHETGSKRARILGKATRLDVVVTAQMGCKKSLDTHRREAERAGRELEEVSAQLAGLPDVRALELRLNEVLGRQALVDKAFTLMNRARVVGDRLAEVRARARAVDTSRIRRELQRTSDTLDKAELLSLLHQKILEVQETDNASAEVHRDREWAQAEYTTACLEAGVCAVCGGLLNHKVCKP